MSYCTRIQCSGCDCISRKLSEASTVKRDWFGLLCSVTIALSGVLFLCIQELFIGVTSIILSGFCLGHMFTQSIYVGYLDYWRSRAIDSEIKSIKRNSTNQGEMHQ